jgi:hypothetical protein
MTAMGAVVWCSSGSESECAAAGYWRCEVRIATARDKQLTLLFDSGSALDERIFAEQFQV